jgi:enoyl-CoA hydratase/carnithine racemase
MAEPPVLTSSDDGVQVVTINRPQARNAIDRETAEGIAAALDALDTADELRVSVITGAGGNFSAGMDLKAFARGERPHVESRGSGGIVQRPPSKPLIAAVEGYAVALGFEVVLSCDLVVASRHARFGLPEVKRSLVAVAGGLIRLPRRIPYHQAMELALTGELIDAGRARDLGLVNRLVEPGQALTEARGLAGQLIANGPLALQASKAIVSRSQDWTLDEAWQRQGEIAGPVFTSEDAREGAIAFAEKRQPVWEGR